MTRRREIWQGMLATGLCLSFRVVPAWGAGSKAPPGGELYSKLNTIALEFWDMDGKFHSVYIDLTAVFSEPPQLNKTITAQISQRLAIMSWESFNSGNPATTIKTIALEILRADPGSAKCKDVLISRLMIR